MLLKKGAMFGLDARIALAIFGALSVISGAALYSAIQEAKVVSFLTELKEVGKAEEQYLLDTGQEVPKNSSSAFYLMSKELAANGESVKNWKGPYLSYDITGNNLDSEEFGFIALARLLTDEWADGSTIFTNESCVVNKNCGLWILVTGVTNPSLVEALDTKIDGSVDNLTGNFRYNKTIATGSPFIILLFHRNSLDQP